MSWINKILPSGISRSEGDKRASVPEGVWTKCIKCDAVLYRPDLERNANVCPKCDHHMRIGARRRLDLFLDPEDREEVFSEIEPIDRLKFRDKRKYIVRLAAAQKDTGERDALVAMRGHLHSMPVVCVAFEFKFHGGSMGQAVGEKFSRAAQLALKERIPLICFSASGGARMQEALISLMQMAKTSAVIERMHSEGIPYISVLTDPVYGGVSASLALLGDLNIAEPEARAGFAGPNIIEQTIRQKLPKGFQRSEFLLEHGAIDMIVPRVELRDTIARAIAKFCDLEAITPEPEEEALDEDGDGQSNGDSGEAGAKAPDVGAGAVPTDIAAATAVAEAAEAAQAADAAIEAAEAAADRAAEAEAVAGDAATAVSDAGAESSADTGDGDASAADGAAAAQQSDMAAAVTDRPDADSAAASSDAEDAVAAAGTDAVAEAADESVSQASDDTSHDKSQDTSQDTSQDQSDVAGDDASDGTAGNLSDIEKGVAAADGTDAAQDEKENDKKNDEKNDEKNAKKSGKKGDKKTDA